MKLYFNENFEIIKREDENIYRGSELYNKLHVYFPQNILKQYLILYPIFSYKRVDNREGSEIGFTQINSDDAEWYEWYDVLPDKALEVNGVLQITITFKLVKNEGDVIAKKTTGKVLLNVKDAIISDTDIIYTDNAENTVKSMLSQITAAYSVIGDLRKQINDILDGTKSAAHAIDAETAQYAIYDINGNEIIDYYAKLVDLQNHLTEYENHLQDFAQHAETARKYFEGDVAIPKAIADKYGNDIPSTYATHLDVQMTFDSLNQHLEEINPYFNGTKAIPKAEKDRNGNTIDLTYATISSLNAVLNDIAAIKTVLTSNDTDLDTLQELVNALKNNVASIGDLFLQIGYKANKADVFTKQEVVDLIDSKLGDVESLLEAI